MPYNSIIAEHIAVEGYVILRCFNPNLTSLNAFQLLGHIDEVEGLGVVQTLKPHATKEAPPNTYSGNFGTSDFPLHTDLAHWAVPPRYVALRCITGSPTVTTRLWDGQQLVTEFGSSTLRRTLMQPRRPLRNGKQLLRLVERPELQSPDMIRWDSIYLKPANNFAENVFAEILTLLSNTRTLNVELLELGDTLILDNWRWFHGRSATPADAHDRHIDRTYIKALI